MVTPMRRGKCNKTETSVEPDQTLAVRRVAMTWAQYLKRVYNIDIETCRMCGSAVKVIACIDVSEVIKKILTHLNERTASTHAAQWPENRVPPPAGLFD